MKRIKTITLFGLLPYELYSKIADYIDDSSTAFRFLMLTKEMYHFFNSQHSEAKFRNVEFVLQNQIQEEQRKIYYVIKLIIKCFVICDLHVNFPNIKSCTVLNVQSSNKQES